MSTQFAGNSALLSPGPVKEVRLALTTRCNLRCVYCAVSQNSYVGVDMAQPEIDRAVRSIVALSRYHDLDPVDLNGHGETTIVEGWVESCKTLFEAGLDVRLTTNFAKEFSGDELETLARLKAITISIDTADRKLLKRMRRRVDLRQIISNIVLVRAAARSRSMPGPKFGFLAGLYDQNSLLVEDLARLAVTLGVVTVGFWSLTKYPYEKTNVPEADRPMPLDDLPDAELLPRLLAIRRAAALLRRAGVNVSMQGDFVNTLIRKRGLLQ